MTVNDKSILKMCKSLARRYKDPILYDDLVSEGLVACYEAKAKGKGNLKELTGAARRAMNDFKNIKCKTLSIPTTWASRAVSRRPEATSMDRISSNTFKCLSEALKNDTTDTSELKAHTQDHAEAFEKDEYEGHLMKVAYMSLSAPDLTFLKQRYFKEMSQDALAVEYGVSQSAISMREDKILTELRNNL